MAHSLSAKKRIRQNDKHRALNRARKAVVKKTLKDFEAAAKTNDAPKTLEALKAAVKKLDRVATKGTLHKRAAARKKSQLQRRYNALAAGAKS